MEMEYSDYYRRPYQAVNMPQAYHGYQQHQQNEQPQQAQQQYQYWNQHHHLVALYQQHHRAALMMGHGGMHGSKQAEPKPRLAKDEVELLEREFAKNPKPNSSTKRELAEQMGVEVPRINNWFQNRRAKEKQMKKTAEFEAQQARERANSESSSVDDQDQVAEGDYNSTTFQQQMGMSTAIFGEPDSCHDDSDETQSDRHQSVFEESEADVPNQAPTQHTTSSPASPSSDGYVQVEYDNTASAVQTSHMMSGLSHAATQPNPFDQEHNEEEFQTPVPFDMGLSAPHVRDGLMPSFEVIPAQDETLQGHNMNTFTERGYFDMSLPQFPSQLIAEGLPSNSDGSPGHTQSPEVHIKPENLSPCSLPASLPMGADLRFKSPPPPTDIASRRNMRRPAPLGLSAMRGGAGPKTSLEAPRRSETASPMRRISSATGGLPGRIQKSFSNGPRSPFMMERTKEAIFQSLQNSQAQAAAPLGTALSPVSPAEGNGQNASSDDEQGYTFGAVNGFPVYKADSNMKTPPDTPALASNFPEHFFPSSVDQAWNFVPHDEPLPTPSLCSHGGSELEFSVAPQMPGYVASSQPVTPSFPPSIGPTYNGFFNGANLTNAEYTFPDSYPAESSARSSPIAPPKTRQLQFQFAQNVTPQDFNK